MNDDSDESSSKKSRLLYPVLIAFTIITTLSHHVSADDAAVMAKLAKSLSPAPPGWSGSNPCKWSGVSCDSSGKVTRINVGGKYISGEIPSEVNQLSSLKLLNLQKNKLSGSLPALSNMPSLEEVHLDNNNFSSVPPDFLSGLSALQQFSMDDNSNLPPWKIPENLSDSTSLVSISAGGANIAGPIPDIFGSFPSLEYLRLSYNNLTGSLPKSLGKSPLQTLILNNQANGLSGRPDVLGNMSQLAQAWLHVNKFKGPIPDLSGLGSLFDLQLRDNQLTGVVPQSISKLSKLANVSLQNNRLQGPVPSFPKNVKVNLGDMNSFCNSSPGPCDPRVNTLLEVASSLGYPVELAESWKKNDPCSDWYGITCSSGRVTVINFAKRDFSGTISPALSNISSLKSIVLSDNKLYGTIPEVLTTLSQLQLLDITNNNISGKVPSFSSRVTLKTSGNPFIGKNVTIYPTSNGEHSSGTDNSSSNGTDSQSSENKASISPWVIVASIVAAVIVIVILCLIIYKCYVKRRGAKYKGIKDSENGNVKENLKSNGASDHSEVQSHSSTSNSDLHGYDGGKFLIPIEVLREVTNNFSEENVLGKGGFGIVYRGRLPDGTQIAVKRMEASSVSSKGLSEFKAEIEVLTKVRHRHLVALHGFCENGNERLLVYEYMPQGTLSQHLFQYGEMGVPPLTWKQRVSIALDVARGVEYLHSLAQQSFIHRDLKPSNVLLGDDMRAKVSDFGLVKSTPDGKHSVETRLAGTFGYLAPEYAATGRVTTKVDVFAFGVILMEKITGRKALEESLPDDKVHLVTWFRKVLVNRDAIRDSLDPILNPDEQTFESIIKVAELAGHCTAREPHQRPDMGHVVNVLSPLVQTWTPTKPEEEEDSFTIDLHMSLPQALQRWKANDDKTSTYSDTNNFSSTSTSAAKKKMVTDSTGSFSSRDA